MNHERPSSPSPGTGPARPQDRPAPPARPALTSAALLGGRSTVLIEHRGALYELRETRLGKLILTK